jgi:hypothetical protein
MSSWIYSKPIFIEIEFKEMIQTRTYQLMYSYLFDKDTFNKVIPDFVSIQEIEKI